MTLKKAMCLSSPPPSSIVRLSPLLIPVFCFLPPLFLVFRSGSILFRISFLKSIFSHVKKICCLLSSHALFLVSCTFSPPSHSALSLSPRLPLPLSRFQFSVVQLGCTAGKLETDAETADVSYTCDRRSRPFSLPCDLPLSVSCPQG